MSATTAIKPSLAGLWALLASLGPHPRQPPPEPPVATVLCYHNFDAQKVTAYTIDSRRFEEQMRFLSVQHLPVIPLKDLVGYLRGGAPIPDQAVVLTIDDGYRTVRSKAWPVLRHFGFPFTIFIYPQFVGHAAALSWQDLQYLADHGVDVESHSLTHPLLTHPRKPMTHAAYIDWVDKELRESKQELEMRLGKPVTVLAYPFGGYDEQVVDRARQAGYQAALTCDDGNVERGIDPLHVNRRLVYRHVRLREFTEYFPDRTLHVADLSPRDGERVIKPLETIRGRILNAGNVLPGSAKILIDKVGHHASPLPFDPQTGYFQFRLPASHPKGYYFVSLFAEDRTLHTLHREASWVFILSKNISK